MADDRDEHLIDVRVTVNGVARNARVRPAERAVDTIRERFGLTGTKVVCEGGVCGSCTIDLDGRDVVTCLLPASRLDGAAVTTIEGLGGADGHPVQRAFAEHDALQCGYCTPGFVLGAARFVDRWRDGGHDRPPTRDEIDAALAGHLCRCGSYAAIHRAITAACDERASGGWGTRIGAEAKVRGAAAYTTDVVPDGAAEGLIVRAAAAPGRLAALDLDAARDLDGVSAVVALAATGTQVRWVGQPLAAVAAVDIETARRAAELVRPKIRQRAGVYDIDQAVATRAPRVYRRFWQAWRAPRNTPWPAIPLFWRRNRHGPLPLAWGGTVARRRLAKARAEGNPLLSEGVYETAVQVHASFEPHAAVVSWSDDGVRAWVSTQAVDHVRHELASAFDLRPDDVTVTSTYVGGGFGSKLQLTDETRAAVELSRAAGTPVRVVLDRREEMTATGSRPATRTQVAMLAEPDGSLVASSFETVSDGGVSVGGTVAALDLLMYGRSARRSRDTDVVTNAQPSTEMRGPCAPPAAWALESTIDDLAHRLDEDPITLRLRLDGNAKRAALYEHVAASDLWRRRRPTGTDSGRHRRGIGVASSNWLYLVDPGTEVTVSVERGRLRVSCSAQDIGQGSATVLANVVAGVFEVDADDVDVEIGRSTDLHGPMSGGSRTTNSLAPTAHEAATKLRNQIGRRPADHHGHASATARWGGDRGLRFLPITVNDIQIGWGFTAAVHAVEVAVDVATGRIHVDQVVAAVAAGTIYAPDQARRQVEGAVVQGIGYALYEGTRLDPNTGVNLTDNLQDYRIAQLGDTPDIDVTFHTRGWPRVPGGGVGLGEVAGIGVAAAVGNATFNATGWRPTQLPIRPDRVIEGIAWT